MLQVNELECFFSSSAFDSIYWWNEKKKMPVEERT